MAVTGTATADSVDDIAGALTIGTPAVGPVSSAGVNFISVTPNVGRNAKLTAASLTRSNNAVAIITGTNLGAAPANGVANVVFDTSLSSQLVGGGGTAGTTTISILPWAIGSTTAGITTAAAANFVTYDDTNGIRPLSALAGEYAISITSGTADGQRHARCVAARLATINAATTINSLYINPSGTADTIAGAGTLTVTSGAVFLGANATTAINCPLDFGTAEGVIGYTKGEPSQIAGVISGTGGVTFYQPSTTTIPTSGR